MPLSPIPIFIGTTLAVVGSGYVFKKFIYDPHLAPIIEALIAAAQGQVPQRIPEDHHYRHPIPVAASSASSTASRYHQTHARRRSTVNRRQQEDQYVLREDKDRDGWGRPSHQLGERYPAEQDDIYAPRPMIQAYPQKPTFPDGRARVHDNHHKLAPLYHHKPLHPVIDVPLVDLDDVPRPRHGISHSDLDGIDFNHAPLTQILENVGSAQHALASSASTRLDDYHRLRHSEAESEVVPPHELLFPPISRPSESSLDLSPIGSLTLPSAGLPSIFPADSIPISFNEQAEWAEVEVPRDFHSFDSGQAVSVTGDEYETMSSASFSTYADGEDYSTTSVALTPASERYTNVDSPAGLPSHHAPSLQTALEAHADRPAIRHSGPASVASVESTSDDELGSDWDAVSQY